MKSRLGVGFRERVKRDGVVRALVGAIGWRLQRALSPAYTALVPPHRWPLALVRERVDTQLDLLKLENLVKFLEETNFLKGHVVECGVYRGGTLVTLALWLERLGSGRRVHGFDSFEGLPEPSMHDKPANMEQRAIKGRLAGTEDAVWAKARRLSVADRVVLHKGFFEETIPAFSDSPLSLIHLDCDLFASYKVCLTHLWPRLQPGGVVVFDEFEDPAWPGARLAIEEFFRNTVEKPTTLAFGQGYVRKLPPRARGRGHGEL
jgi:hypothetical protein